MASVNDTPLAQLLTRDPLPPDTTPQLDLFTAKPTRTRRPARHHTRRRARALHHDLLRLLAKADLCPHGLDCAQCCWNWNGTINYDGYGMVGYHGSQYFAHRLFYHLRYGIPRHKLACHTCHNRRCCNWHHIYPGTYASNSADRWRRRHESLPGTPPPYLPRTHSQTSTPILDPRWTILFGWDSP